MDRKSIIVLVVSFSLMLFWYTVLIPYLYPPKPAPASLGTPSGVTNQLEPGTNAPGIISAPLEQSAPLTQTFTPEELVIVENKEARYTFTSHGGGLKRVELKGYPETVSCPRDKKGATRLASLNTDAPLPVLALTGSAAVKGDGIFKLTTNANGVRAEMLLPNGLSIIKEFRPQSNYLVAVTVRLQNTSAQPLMLSAQEWIVGTATPMGPKDDGTLMGVFWFNGKGAEHVTTTWFLNKTLGCFPGTPREQYMAGNSNVHWAAVHNQFFALAVMPPTNVVASHVITRQITLPPLRANTNARPTIGTNNVGNIWLFAEADFADVPALASKLRSGQDALATQLQQRLSPETQRLVSSYPGSGALPQPLLTALIADLNKVLQGPSLYLSNKDYFVRLQLKGDVRQLLDQSLGGEDVVRINRLLLEAAFIRELRQSPAGYLASLVYPPLTLGSNQSEERQFHIYAGPKEYKTLSRIGSLFQNRVDLVMDFGFFSWFAQLLLTSMNGLQALGLSYGLAIIVITILIKLIFWPLTNASTRSMKRMAAFAPQMKALQEKYKDDPQKVQRKLWEFYKEHKINPAAGCLPVLVQMPIFFGFYTMIRSAIELRGASFLWVCDLSQPDTLFVIPGLGFIPLIAIPGAGLPVNPLPLLMGVTMLWQARLTPPSPGMDPMQQKIMRYMPLMFLAILYNFSAGLTLYWTVQNLLSIAQMKLTKAKDAPAAVAKAPAPVVPVKKKKK